MTERKHPNAKCEDCDLFSDGVFVPTKFPNGQATFAVVGEAPGLQEASTGEPFVGPSGKLLNRVLEYHGIKRSEVILTNACLCRPPDNATPSKVAIECCRKRLIHDVSGVQRVLALGNSASQSLLQTTRGITTTRIGRPKQSPEGLTVVPSFHPAYCLRSGDQFPHLVNDTRKLVHDLQEWTPPQYVVADDEEFALAIIEELEAFDTLVIDIECGIDKDNDFDHPNRYQMLCIGICYAKGKVVIIGERCFQFPSIIEALRKLFGKSKLVGHNLKFDLAGLYPLLGTLRAWFDTMLASYSINERPGNHKLEQLGQELLGMPDWKQEIQKYLGPGKNYASIPRPTLYKYNAYDVAGTWDLVEYFVAELERLGLRHLHDFLVDASNELMFLELNGITVDKDRSRELSEEYEKVLEGLEEQLDELVGQDYDKAGGINPRSPLQVKKFLHDHKIRVANTNEDTLKQVATRVDSTSTVGLFIGTLLTHRRKAKLHGTYIKGIRSRTYRGRVYTTYLLHGTTSGRLASRNPNLQNIVRDNAIKSQFTVSKPENIFVAVDYKQAEGRVICTLAQDENLAQIFRDTERDIFDELGKQLYPGVSKLNKDQRVRVKAYFYGLSYGREAFSIAQEYNLPVRETEIGLAKFFALIPDVVKWQFRVKQQVLNGEDLVTSFGRHRRFWLITQQNKKDVLNEALSYLPQSTASDICLKALVRVRPMLRGLGFIRLTIHDQLVAECQEERKDEVAHLLSSVMVEEAAKWTDYVPFTVDVSYGKNWGELS